MQIRTADGEEMLKLWGYQDAEDASPTARFFYHNISTGNAVFWTADLDGELIGELYAFSDIEDDRDFADGTTTAYLCAFRIRKDLRGQGIGSKLMNKVLADLKSRGFTKATIGVSEKRTRLLYNRFGFTKFIKECHYDPCARDENMDPEYDEAGFSLLVKNL